MIVAVLAHGQHHHLVARLGQVGLVHVHAALGTVKGVLVGVALVLRIAGRLAQRLKECVKHLLVLEVVVVQDVAGIIGDACEELIGQLTARLIDVQHGVVVELQRLAVALQTAEHGPVGHVVAVDHRHGVAEVRLVVVRLDVQRAGLVGLAVQIALQVVIVVIPGAALSGLGTLRQIVALADGALGGVGNLDEPEHVRILLLVKADAVRQLDGLRLHDDLILGVRFRFLLLAAAHQHGRAQRQQRHHKRHSA